MNSLIDSIIQFITTYFIDPIRYDVAYNPINTVVYAIILGISIFGVIKLLDKMDIKIDKKFVLSNISFVLAGSTLRVMEDANILEPPISFFLITPIIYFVVFFVTVACLVISKWAYNIKKVKSYYAMFSMLGFVWFIINMVILLYFKDIVNFTSLIYIISIGAIATIASHKILNYLKINLLSDKLNLAIFFAHMLDSASTFIGIDLHGYVDKHVVPLYFIELTGTGLVMFPLKLIVMIPILYLINTQFEEKDKKIKIFMQMVLIILGLAPAIRNTIRILLGT